MNWFRIGQALLTSLLCGTIHAGSAPATELAAGPASPNAGSYKVRYFDPSGIEGLGSWGNVIQGPDGAFYGTTAAAGEFGHGTIYKLSKVAVGSKLKVLHSFTGADGQFGGGLVVGTDGAIYGQADFGGDNGYGTAFKISTNGRFKLLHSFAYATEGYSDGLGTWVEGPDANFYGTMPYGGPLGHGTAYKMSPKGKVTVLHAFAGGPGDGATPSGQLTLGSDGNFYGATHFGGANDPDNQLGGTIYRMTPSGAVTLLHSFDCRANGCGPDAPPTQVGKLLYGPAGGGANSDGIIYSMNLNGQNFQVLHAFTDDEGAATEARMLLASDGALYGVQALKGPNSLHRTFGDGTLFKFKNNVLTVIHAFGAFANDGSYPASPLIQATDGSLLGTTRFGGPNEGEGNGVVFRLTLP